MAQGEGLPPKRRKHDYIDTITVLVGSIEEKFTVHEEVITRSSDFFRAACSSNFKEAREKIVRLPGIIPDIFESYIHWAYNGVVVMKEDDEPPSGGGWGSGNVALLYVAGDVLGDMHLRNAIIDRIITYTTDTRHGQGVEAVKLAYCQTPERSTLRTLLIDYYLLEFFPERFKQIGPQLPAAFLLDVIHGRMLNKNEKTAKPCPANKCKYHEHNDELPKCEA